MPRESAPVEGRCEEDTRSKGGKTRLLTLNDLDGRTAAKREIEERISAIQSDLGGADRLTQLQRDMVEQTAILRGMLTDTAVKWLGGAPIDPTAYCTLANTHRRLAETLGLSRVARDVTPSLDSYLGNASQRANSATEAA